MYSSAAEQLQKSSDERMNFSDIKLMDPLRKSLDKTFGYQKMSIVQEKVLISSTTDKTDLLVRAKTGTGKTLAFLVSAIQRLQQDPVRWKRILDRKAGISILIISPTRELAIQIQQEATKLCSFLPLKSVVCCGGDSRNVQLQQIQRGADICVATPGRLLDFLNSARVFQDNIRDNQVLILDEADRLLEMGFKQDIEDVCRIIPKERQTLCFSATFSPEMRRVAATVLKRDYTSLDCVPADEVDTHLRIRQSYIEASFSQTLPTLLDLFNKHKEANPNFKIIVFFPTAVSTGFFAQLFNWTTGFGEVLEIHSRLTQAGRARVSRRFKESRNSILFTTDVSARGVDYPGVTLVLQVGVPSTRDDYIHRIGRTGRANKSGEAILLATPYELGFLRLIKDLPIKADVRHSGATSAAKPELVSAMKTAMEKFSPEDKTTLFTAWCGSAKSTFNQYSSGSYQKAAQDFAQNLLGLPDIPYMSPSFASKIGLAPSRGIRSGGGGFVNGIFGRQSGGYSSSDSGYSRGFGRGQLGGYSDSSRSSGGYGGSSNGYRSNDRNDRGGGYGGYGNNRANGNERSDRGGSLSDFMRMREKLNK